jgi:hypothetical protein
MASDYRLYFLDPSNHITSAQDFQNQDDNGAIAHAMDCADRRDVELWSGARLVARISGKIAHIRAA